MILLKTGQQLKVRHREKGILVTVALIGMDEGKLTLSLEGAMAFEQNDEVELEVPQERDAPYLLQARLGGVGPGNICTLELQGEPTHMERRRSRRIPTSLQAQYHLLPQYGKGDYLQAEILDISSSGAFLTTEGPLKVNSKLMLTFQLPRGNNEDFTTGTGCRVVHKHTGQTPKEHAYGVEFNRQLALSE